MLEHPTTGSRRGHPVVTSAAEEDGVQASGRRARRDGHCPGLARGDRQIPAHALISSGYGAISAFRS